MASWFWELLVIPFVRMAPGFPRCYYYLWSMIKDEDVKTRPLNRIDIVVFQIQFNVINFRNRIFHAFSYVVRFSLSFLRLLVYNKILIDCVLRKQYVLLTLDRQCFLRLRLGKIKVSGQQNLLFPSCTFIKC